MHVCLWHMCAGAHIAHKRVSDPLELELQALVSPDAREGNWAPLLCKSQQLTLTTEPSLKFL